MSLQVLRTTCICQIPGNIFDKEEAHAIRRTFVAARTGITIIVSVAGQLNHLTHMFTQGIVRSNQQMHRPIIFCQPVVVWMAG